MFDYAKPAAKRGLTAAERVYRMIKAVIYDMDGTLMDSERVSIASWHETNRRLGISIPDDVLNSLIGRNAVSCRKIICDYLDGDEQLAGRAFQVHADLFDELCLTELELKPGARESIDALRAAGCHVALATSTARVRAVARLDRFGLVDAFEAITCGDEVERSKPAPDIFLTAAERLHVEPEFCAVVEDSFNGVRAGHAAGMHVFMVPDVLQPTREVAALCDEVLPTLCELPAAIARVR